MFRATFDARRHAMWSYKNTYSLDLCTQTEKAEPF